MRNMSTNPWSPLARDLENQIWHEFESRFEFRQGGTADDWPGIVEPNPSVTYSISRPFVEARDRQEFLSIGKQLNIAVFHAFQRCVPLGAIIYALDWNHPCYTLQPDALEDLGSRPRW